jgi:hypothetical protein
MIDLIANCLPPRAFGWTTSGRMRAQSCFLMENYSVGSQLQVVRSRE